MAMRLQGLLAAAVAFIGCSRDFRAPAAQQQAPPRIALAAPVGFEDGGGSVLRHPDGGGVPIVRGHIRVHVTDAGGGPAKRVDIWTPGKPHEDADGEGNWDVATEEIWPVGGVMTIYATPFDLNGLAAAPFQASYIVDNSPPRVVVESPLPSSALRPGPFQLRFCAYDRPNVSSIKVGVTRESGDGGLATLADGSTDYGADLLGDGGTTHCYLSGPIDGEPDGRSLVTLQLTASDDVGNTSLTQVEYRVSRVIGEGLLPGIPPPSSPGAYPPIAFSSGFGLNLRLSDTAPGPAMECWIDGDGIRSRVLDVAVNRELALPGSDSTFIEIDGTRPAQPVLRRVSRLEDGGYSIVNAGPGPANWTQTGGALRTAAGAHMSCLAPSSYSEPLDGGTLLCFLADGGTLVADLPLLGSGADALDTLLVLQHQVAFRVSRSIPADGGTTQVLARYDVEAGLQRLPDLPIDASLQPGSCLSTFAGATCDQLQGAGGPVAGPSIHLDGSTGALSVFDSRNLPGLASLGATPNGGVVGLFPRPAIGQQDVREVLPDGSSSLLGCVGMGPTSVTARFDAFHHLYVAYVDELHGNPVLLAFAPDAGLSWSYAGSPLPLQLSAPPDLAFDPLVSPTDPASTLLLSLDDRNAYVILSRLDPASGARAFCKP
jgi:hypothetical protein